jgi:cytochrome c oxidase assembly protein subunit 11
MSAPLPPPARSPRHLGVAITVGVTVVVMVGLSYAAVPLYKLFCQRTGFAGTPQVAEAPPTIRGKRHITVRFDTNVGAGLPWSFEPETDQVVLQTGQTATVYFKVTNEASRAVTGQASYNVSPDVIGGYFDKITCFCFSEQTLDAGQTLDMPVVFFLDPKLEQDPTLKGVDAVTLSYTFYPVRTPPKPLAQATPSSPRL